MPVHDAQRRQLEDTIVSATKVRELQPLIDAHGVVCDLLALRRDGGRSTPVLLELKDARMLTRLVEQVERYAALIDAHADLFAKLFGALLGETITFDGPAERWIVWPEPTNGPEKHEADLRKRNIRVVTYSGPAEGRYTMRIGDR